MTEHIDYKLVRPDLVEVEDHNGNKIFISPLHKKYKELKQLEQARKSSE